MLLQILDNLESSNNQDALPYVSSKECLRSRARRYVLLIFFLGGGDYKRIWLSFSLAEQNLHQTSVIYDTVPPLSLFAGNTSPAV